MLILARIWLMKECSWELMANFPKGSVDADFEAVCRHRRWIKTGRPLSLLFWPFPNEIRLSPNLQNIDFARISNKQVEKHFERRITKVTKNEKMMLMSIGAKMMLSLVFCFFSFYRCIWPQFCDFFCLFFLTKTNIFCMLIHTKMFLRFAHTK